MSPATRTARVLGSGWTPAALVLVFAAWLLHDAALVSLRDLVFFGAYVVGWLVVPGVVLWRWVDRRAPRPLVEDLALGVLVGYVVEIPVYLACLAAGHPRAYLAWPALVLVPALSTRAGRRLLARRGGRRMTPAWSWSVAGLLGYVVLWFAHHVWGPSPAAGPTVRSPYIDEPYHLSLVASLRHFFGPKVLFVDDTPLQYHYLSHVHLAAASWVSGVEPVVLLRALALPTMAVAALLALAVAASRLAQRTWVGPVALAAILVVPADFSGGRDRGRAGFLGMHLELSPSAAFANVCLLLGVLLVIELLRRDVGGVRVWALTAVTMVVMCGAKATTLPVVVAGLLLTSVVSSAAHRTLARRPVALTLLGAGCFLLARALFFGPNAQGLEVDPLGIFGRVGHTFPQLAGHDGHPGLAVSAVIAVSLLCAVTLGAGLLAGLAGGGWREEAPVFLLGACVAGYALALSVHQDGYSEGYFIVAVQILLPLGAVLGVARHTDRLAVLGRGLTVGGRYPGGRVLALVAVATGLGAGLVAVAWVHPYSPDGGAPAWLAFRIFAVPTFVLLLGGAALTGLVVQVALRRGGHGAGTLSVATWAVVAALVFAGLGLTPTVHRAHRLLEDPVPAPVVHSALIAPGGIAAARYLRAHTPLDAVVATNAHCEFAPRLVPHCMPRNFWMAGYAERQFLVEGWAYVSRASVGLHPGPGENIKDGPFWDPDRLAANDRAFRHPDAASLRVLRDRYGVRWLLVDRRYPARTDLLRRQADVVFRSGRYLVLALR